MILLFTFFINYPQLCYSQNYPPITCSEYLPSDITIATPENFTAICTDPNSVKYLRVNYHFILKDDGTGNFNEYGDGQGNGNQYNGFVRAKEIIENANSELSALTENWLPSGETKTVLPTRFRYILTGVYFHRDSKMFNKDHSTNYFLAGHKKYDINPESSINVYDTKIIGASGFATGIGVQQGDYTCFVDNYDAYLAYPTWDAHPAQLLNHEIGHILDLRHSFSAPSTDKCDDTPPNPNCWAFTGTPPCDTWNNISNNIMDYNQYYPHAYTPCQVGRIHDYLNGPKGNYIIHSCNACKPANALAWIEREKCVLPRKFYQVKLNCQGSYNVDKYLLEICEIADNDNLDCTGGYYNSGWINGAPGVLDLSSVYTFTPDKHYKIRFSGDNTDCPSLSSSVNIIYTKDCGETGTSDPHIIINPIVAPNPGSGLRTISFSLSKQADVSIYLVNGSTSQIQSQILDSYSLQPVLNLFGFNDSGLANGQHYVTITADNELNSIPFIIN